MKFLEVELLRQQECTFVKPSGPGEAVSKVSQRKKQVCWEQQGGWLPQGAGEAGKAMVGER